MLNRNDFLIAIKIDITWDLESNRSKIAEDDIAYK